MILVWIYVFALQVEERSNQIANYFLSEGYQKGDGVALFMENSPQYIIIWLGLAKIGVVSALVNFNLKNQGLVHTIKLAKSRAIIFGSTLESSKLYLLTLYTRPRENFWGCLAPIIFE